MNQLYFGLEKTIFLSTKIERESFKIFIEILIRQVCNTHLYNINKLLKQKQCESMY